MYLCVCARVCACVCVCVCVRACVRVCVCVGGGGVFPCSLHDAAPTVTCCAKLVCSLLGKAWSFIINLRVSRNHAKT